MPNNKKTSGYSKLTIYVLSILCITVIQSCDSPTTENSAEPVSTVNTINVEDLGESLNNLATGMTTVEQVIFGQDLLILSASVSQEKFTPTSETFYTSDKYALTLFDLKSAFIENTTLDNVLATSLGLTQRRSIAINIGELIDGLTPSEIHEAATKRRSEIYMQYWETISAKQHEYVKQIETTEKNILATMDTYKRIVAFQSDPLNDEILLTRKHKRLVRNYESNLEDCRKGIEMYRIQIGHLDSTLSKLQTLITDPKPITPMHPIINLSASLLSERCVPEEFNIPEV
ncbi:MAG: hypothetical protein JKY40_10565 [Gammaproteobacteria bacterium]|nr:hypothetical protein [Gammaproteobacteria bacterium]MBL4729728.1 hypothetical protein [Gammaproteobacteria bacterium]